MSDILNKKNLSDSDIDEFIEKVTFAQFRKTEPENTESVITENNPKHEEFTTMPDPEKLLEDSAAWAQIEPEQNVVYDVWFAPKSGGDTVCVDDRFTLTIPKGAIYKQYLRTEESDDVLGIKFIDSDDPVKAGRVSKSRAEKDGSAEFIIFHVGEVNILKAISRDFSETMDIIGKSWLSSNGKSEFSPERAAEDFAEFEEILGKKTILDNTNAKAGSVHFSVMMQTHSTMAIGDGHLVRTERQECDIYGFVIQAWNNIYFALDYNNIGIGPFHADDKPAERIISSLKAVHPDDTAARERIRKEQEQKRLEEERKRAEQEKEKQRLKEKIEKAYDRKVKAWEKECKEIEDKKAEHVAERLAELSAEEQKAIEKFNRERASLVSDKTWRLTEIEAEISEYEEQAKTMNYMKRVITSKKILSYDEEIEKLQSFIAKESERLAESIEKIRTDYSEKTEKINEEADKKYPLPKKPDKATIEVEMRLAEK